jgi:hypothetical protein
VFFLVLEIKGNGRIQETREREKGDGVIREPAQSRFVGGYQNSSFI